MRASSTLRGELEKDRKSVYREKMKHKCRDERERVPIQHSTLCPPITLYRIYTFFFFLLKPLELTPVISNQTS